MVVELIHKIYESFSNIHEVHCRLSDIEEQGVVFDIYVKSNQETALSEYDELLQWMLYNNKAVILVHGI